ncbi:succinate dehydrogenase, cytochrome b556 subunit [Sediminicurvatus halobius]|uniref:Succinate dehydrogenase cytochrome b556 subunit n=1 Tax=Sediminicurvatus halobius TaxID=2182432 RepID=A0A2U2MVU6_9GAMM|nr:succinate dehydrogenase, cytochrome b556 subunit [Spiribacter halobius]PWG60952.1 succinate dehydrogenase, cytochrome b556 subunit [Spiribacter halobius]UEX76622.1 succinate dehydrogenase, cytochrome b556 subunit [Spiribacter halobius]
MAADRRRPLSPHVQVYRPQLTSVLSILHRLSGLLLGLAAPAFVLWLAAVAAGPFWYATARALLSGPVGRVALLVVVFAFFYHLCNGVRHLAWDAGYGFELRRIYASGWTVVLASLLLTALTALLALLPWGASS